MHFQFCILLNELLHSATIGKLIFLWQILLRMTTRFAATIASQLGRRTGFHLATVLKRYVYQVIRQIFLEAIVTVLAHIIS